MLTRISRREPHEESAPERLESRGDHHGQVSVRWCRVPLLRTRLERLVGTTLKHSTLGDRGGRCGRRSGWPVASSRSQHHPPRHQAGEHLGASISTRNPSCHLRLWMVQGCETGHMDARCRDSAVQGSRD